MSPVWASKELKSNPPPTEYGLDKDGWQKKSTSYGKVEFSLFLSVLPKIIQIFLETPPL